MAINFNTEPYYDDFDQTKNFHRILFKPGYAVQARELTQLQTQLQDQIKKFGNNIFVEGTVVLDGQRFFEKKNVSHIKIGTNLFGNIITKEKIIGKTLTGGTSGSKALIKGISFEQNIGNVLVVTVTAGTDFIPSETISIVDSGTTYQTTISPITTINNVTVSPFGDAMMFSVGQGVYYVGGKFVYTGRQSIILDALRNTSSKNVGFDVIESATSAETDETLLDNAQGTPNYAAPGADRYAVELKLTSKDTTTPRNDFIEIARIENGELIVDNEKTVYSQIGNELARRTFDESGDYTVKEWKIQLEENPANSAKFIANLEPGKGYIKGYEFETITQTPLEIDKGRDIETVTDANATIAYGNFVHVSTMSGVFNPNSLQSVELKDTSGLTIGTARIKYLEYVTGTIEPVAPAVTATAVYRMYLLGITMNTGKTIGLVNRITSGTASALIDALSKQAGTGVTFLSGTDAPGLLFQSIDQYTKNINSINYRYQRVFSNITFTAGRASIPSGLRETFVGGTGALNTIVKNLNYHVVVTTASQDGTYPEGKVLSFSDGSRSITIVNGDTQQAIFDLADSSASAGFNATIIATFDKNNQDVRTKTLSGYKKSVITNILNKTIGGIDSLGVSDIENIYDVYNIGDNDGISISLNSDTGAINFNGVANTRVTADYILDNGQRADIYDHGGIILIGTAPVKNTDNLLVVYKNYEHSIAGFVFTSDSYSVNGNIPYENIPTFTDPSTGKIYNLRDCFDFRPKRVDGSTNFVIGQIPSPNSTLESNYQYYKGRMDRIVAMPDKRFVIKRGVSSLNPVIPVNDTNGMVIYDVIIPPYTASVKDILIKYVDNKRYTMRDIGKLDKRINNLEYYTQLSLLEKQAKDTSIIGNSNFEKLKHGIAVDPFSSQDIFIASRAGDWTTRRWGWWNSWFNGSNTLNPEGSRNYNDNSIAEPSNLDFNVAIDPVNQELRSPFKVNHSYFNITSLNNTLKDGSLVTLKYTETEFISQPLFTSIINVNPFDVFKFVGKVDLQPPFDNWVDTNLLPAVNKIVDVKAPDTSVTITNTVGSGNRVTTSTSTSIQTNVLSSTTTSLGASVVDVQFVPFIRANTVIVTGKLFKPNARLYPFVESVPVSANCKPLTVLTVTHISGNLFDDTQGVYETLTFTGGATAKTALYSPPTSADPTKRLLYVYGVTGTINVNSTITGTKGGTATVNVVTSSALNGAIIPNEYGSLALEFQIPAGKFKTGERTIRLIDNPDNDLTLQESFGEAKYTATGITQSKQETILTTRSVQTRTVITQTRFQSDPLAQSFFIDDVANPSGMFVSSVEVYFRTKSSTIPITMQIRRTVNGYPESYPSIPFAEVVLDANSVTSSTNGSVATKFTFKSPIHLVPGEYAIVLLANTNEYNVFIAEIGKTVIDGAKIVDKQPHTGSLFISQNARTWTADQNKDLAFKINRADFSSAGDVEFDIQNPVDLLNYYNAFVSASVIAPSNTGINWKIKTTNSDGGTGGTLDTEYTAFNINQDIEFDSLKTLLSSGNTLKIKGELVTSDSKVSPAVDAASLTIVTAINDINNDSARESQSLVTAGSFVAGERYGIVSLGNTNWGLIGAVAAATGNAGATSNLSGVSITGTAGQFLCSTTNLAVGQLVTISGTFGGTGSITGYTNPTTYKISATNGTTTFTLTTTADAAIVTTTGVPTGLTYALPNTLTISSGATGTFKIGQQVSGTNITAGTTITNIVSGNGGVGSYVLSAAVTGTVSGTVLAYQIGSEFSATDVATGTGVTSGSSTTLTISGTVTGTFKNGMIISGINIVPGTKITAIASGGGTGTYTLSQASTGTVSGTVTGTLATGIGLGTGTATLMAKRGGNAIARYITKPITLADTFEASNLCVTININKPIGTEVKAYYKTLPTEKTTPISEELWSEMVLETPVRNSTSQYEYKEHRFFPVGAFDKFGNPETSPIKPFFNTFQVKLVLLSDSKTKSPKCRDLRIIALYD
jgi:hypothetical protein